MRAVLALALALGATAGVLLLRGSGRSEERATSREALPSPLPADPPAAPASMPEDAAGIPATGRVFDGKWRPVAGAVAETDAARTTTGADGRFALPAGTRSAKVRAKGYATASAYWSSAVRPIEVQLARGGTLAGTVSDAAGRPVPGAGIQSGGVEAVADENGRYALSDLPIGFVDAIEVRAPGRAWQRLARLPDAPVRASTTTEFDPVVETGVTVQGTAPPGATVLLGRARTRADAQGRFRFDGVLPGRHWVRLDPGSSHEIHVGAKGLADIVLADPPRATLRVTGAGRKGTLLIAGNSWEATPGPDGSLLFEDVLATPHASLEVGETDYGLIALPASQTTVFAIPPPALVFEGVVEGPDGHVLGGAEVKISDEAAELRHGSLDRRRGATTDGSGRFRIEVRASARSFALVASHPDFTPAVLRRLDASSDALRLRLGLGVAIDGTVRHDTGEPASHAWIMAHDEDPRWGVWRSHGDDSIVGDVLDAAPPRESRGARSDEAGRFGIEGLVPGMYWVRGEALEVGAGGATIDVTLEKRAEGASIAGIVIDPRGARVAGAVVVAGEISCWTDHAGRFRLDGLEARAHDLVVEPQQSGIVGGEFFAETTVRGVLAPSDDVVVRVGDGRTLRGRILDADGAPLAGASVTLLPPPPPQEQGVFNRPNTPYAITDADGWYEMRGLSDGPVELAAFRDGHLPIVFEAKGDLADERRLPRGESISGVLLDAEGAPAAGRTLRCSLKKPASPADVRPWRRNWDAYGPWFDTRTGDDGRFRITGLPAGEYEVELGAGHDMAPVRMPSGTTGLKLKLLPLRTVAGVVVDEHGQPVCRSGLRRLKISTYHTSGQVGYIPLAEDGSFRFDRVPQGRIRLHVIGWDDFASKEMDVEAGAEDVRVQLAPSPYRER